MTMGMQSAGKPYNKYSKVSNASYKVILCQMQNRVVLQDDNYLYVNLRFFTNQLLCCYQNLVSMQFIIKIHVCRPIIFHYVLSIRKNSEKNTIFTSVVQEVLLGKNVMQNYVTMQAIVRMEEHVLSTTTIPVTKRASVPQDIQVCPSKSISATCIDQILITFSMHIHIESWESTNVDN